MNLRMLGLAMLSGAALMGCTASSASATTLEVGGTTKAESIEFEASRHPQGAVLTKRTTGNPLNICSESTMTAKTNSPYSGAVVTVKLTALTLTGCEPSVTVSDPGAFYIEHIPGTTDGTVLADNLELTVFYAMLGGYLKCKTGEISHIGTLAREKEEHATLHINGAINCGVLVPSMKWEGTWIVTSPTGLNVGS